MSVYAFDADRREILAVWPAGIGSRARIVAQLPPSISSDEADALSSALTRLSEVSWDTYARPASSTEDERESARRDRERESLHGVVAILRAAKPPDEAELMLESYSQVEEAAHHVARLLRELPHAAVATGAVTTDAVTTEIQTEVDAVVRAELGDLTGRAIQAVALTRLDASPIQVSAADAILHADPLGTDLLKAAVDPAAACVAAAHWLTAAATVAAEHAGNTPAGVFAEADDIQPASVAIPALVVERIYDEEAAPREVVLDLLRTAAAAGEGVIADLSAVVAARARLHELVDRLPADQRDQVLADEPARATLLDPRRPARDLLEHLLDGLSSSHILYAEYALDAGPTQDETERPAIAPAATADNEWDIDDDQQREQIALEFVDLVRLEAHATRERLS